MIEQTAEALAAEEFAFGWRRSGAGDDERSVVDRLVRAFDWPEDGFHAVSRHSRARAAVNQWVSVPNRLAWLTDKDIFVDQQRRAMPSRIFGDRRSHAVNHENRPSADPVASTTYN